MRYKKINNLIKRAKLDIRIHIIGVSLWKETKANGKLKFQSYNAHIESVDNFVQ